MFSVLTEIRIWTTQDDINIKPTDYNCYKYYNSVRDVGSGIFDTSKRKYNEARSFKCVVPNKRPEKLRDKLKEFEEALVGNKVVCVNCVEQTVLLLLSKGILVNVKVDKGDISAVNIDRGLTSRVQPDVINDGVICGTNQVICVCKDGRVLGYGGGWKEWVIESGHRRNLSVHGELMVIWGRTGSEHPQPWTPVSKDHQRANLHLYWIGARGPDLLSYRKTDGEPIRVVVSKINHRSVIVVEQKVSQRGSVSIEVCLLELIGSTLKRTSVTAVPLQTQVSCSAISENETYLTLCCIDGSLAVLDRNRGSSRIIKASFIPKHVAWHKSCALFSISNERGQVQYFDTALNNVNIQLINEETTNTLLDVSTYFTQQQTVEILFWNNKYLFICMEQGPFIIFSHVPSSLSFQVLIRMYVRENKLERAIRLLLSWDFNEQAFAALQIIVAHIMRSPLTESTAKLLQDALGSFHCPSVPLSAEVHHKFGAQVKSLTRKFFHQLVRSKMYETSFLLAVDLGHHDLFMDLHYVAVKIGETEMAAAARAQASALVSRCSSEGSNCSRSICSQCSDSSNGESSEESSKDEYPSDNYLSTNFNNPIPKTYKPPYIPPIPSIDLPKIKLLNKPPIVPPLPSMPSLPISSINNIGIPHSSPQMPHESRFIPIRSMPRVPTIPTLSVPSISTMLSMPSVHTVPSIPIHSSMQAIHSSAHSNHSSIPAIHSATQLNHSSIPSSHLAAQSNYASAQSNHSTGQSNHGSVPPIHSSIPTISSVPLIHSSIPSMSSIPPIYPSNSTISSVHPSMYSVPTMPTISPQFKPLPPPLDPVFAFSQPSTSVPSSGQVKKPQAKVKFSDTVTAFIVPEVKRPVRVPPPAHVTDPQKELADSLPLCHPNEDYLKDFTPIRRDGSESPPVQPKIKVVHFGVV